MSYWTGKCDFGDAVEGNVQDFLADYSNIEISNVKLSPKEEKDLIPYYTNLIAVHASASIDGHREHDVRLASGSYLDDLDILHAANTIQELRYIHKHRNNLQVELEIDKAATTELHKNELKYYLSILPSWALEFKDTKQHEVNRLIVEKLADGYWIPQEYTNDRRKAFLAFCEEKGCDMTLPILRNMKWQIERYSWWLEKIASENNCTDSEKEK